MEIRRLTRSRAELGETHETRAEDRAREMTPRVATIVLLRCRDLIERYERRYRRRLSPDQRQVLRKALDRAIARERAGYG